MRAYQTGTSRRVASGAQGFTLVELMIVVIIIGILGMIAIPNYNDHLHATKMTKTTEDMNQIATAWQMNGAQVRQGSWIRTGETVNVASDFPIVLTAQEMELVLDTEVPEIDGWGNPYEYRVDAFPATCVLIRSANSDGVFDDSYVAGTMLPTEDRNTDIVRIDVRWIVRWDPIWRGLIIPPPITIDPPPVW